MGNEGYVPSTRTLDPFSASGHLPTVHHTVASGHDHHTVELGCGQLQVFSSEGARQQFNAHPMPRAIVAKIHHSRQRPFPCRPFEIGKTGLTSPGPFQDAAFAANEIRLELGLGWKDMHVRQQCKQTATLNHVTARCPAHSYGHPGEWSIAWGPAGLWLSGHPPAGFEWPA